MATHTLGEVTHGGKNVRLHRAKFTIVLVLQWKVSEEEEIESLHPYVATMRHASDAS